MRRSFWFFLVSFLYESFRVAIAKLAMPLLAIAAVFIGLWIIGTESNIASRMGLMIVGIVTEVAIFYYAEFAELEEAENALDRFITAGVNRLRPIAMTTFAAAFGHHHHRGLVAQLRSSWSFYRWRLPA